MGGFKHKIQMGWSKKKRRAKKLTMRKGSIIAVVAMAILILTLLGLGLLSIAYGTRLRAVMFQMETIAKMAAEAGYENAIRWMNEQPDVLSAMLPATSRGGSRVRGGAGTGTVMTKKGSGNLSDSEFSYTIDFDHFMGHLPVFRIVSKGTYKEMQHTVEARVVQSIYGLDIGRCEIPTGPHEKNFVSLFFDQADVLDMPIHISGDGNRSSDRSADIRIKGEPHFKQKVSVSESRFMSFGRNNDKYKKMLSLFDNGVYFNQPQSNIAKPAVFGKGNVAMNYKVERFKGSTKTAFCFSRGGGNKTPKADKAVPKEIRAAAVQIEFYIDRSNRGKMIITNNCTVVCNKGGRYDYIVDESITNAHKGYNIYGYHYRNTEDTLSQPQDPDIKESYVPSEIKTSRSPVPIRSEEGGRIFVDGNVIIGGETVDDERDRFIEVGNKWYDAKFKGQLTIVATGNIWIVNSIQYDGNMETTPAGFDIPAEDNPNILGLFSQNGVVKIVDPGQLSSEPPEYANLEYSPIGFKRAGAEGGRGGQASGRSAPPYMRQLPNPMVVHAAITAGGGAWGVENVDQRQDSVNIDPSNPASMLDDLVLAGSITEIRGDMISKNGTGYNKYYYFDKRLLGGILPGDVWLQSKFTPKPGGWSDYRL